MNMSDCKPKGTAAMDDQIQPGLQNLNAAIQLYFEAAAVGELVPSGAAGSANLAPPALLM
jgi:hypothetical protein